MYRWDKPLAPRLETAYYEYMARTVLAELFSERYSELKREDKPDLQDIQKNLGVEVTRALERNFGEIYGLLPKVYYGEDEMQQKATNRIIELGGRFSEDEFRILSWPTGHDNFNAIYCEFEKKLKKINAKGYVKFKNYELFIHSDILADSSMLEHALCELIEKQSNCKEKFELVYVYVPEALYTLDLSKNKFCSTKLETMWQTEATISARERAESNG